MESEYLSDEVLDDVSQQKKRSVRKNLQKKFHKHREQRNSVESDDTEVEDPNLYDSQDDNEDDSEHLADLMAASTTIKSVQSNFSCKYNVVVFLKNCGIILVGEGEGEIFFSYCILSVLPD